MATIAITESEILDAIREATETTITPDDALSVSEMAQALGIGEQAAYGRIKKLYRAGLMECVHVRRQGMDGVIRPRPAYRLLKPKPKKRR